MIIYKAINKINGKIYIGQTVKSLSGRISGHIQGSRLPFGRALRKYGIQSFDISVIDSADTRENLNEKEKYWIKFHNCKHPNGYNLTDGGDGVCNPTDEVRKKMSDAYTPERRKDWSERITGPTNPMKDPATVEKVRIANTGKFASEETKLNMSKASKGKPKSEKHKKNISAGLLNHEVSEETRETLRKARTGSKDSPETREKKRLGSIGHIVSQEACQRMSEERTGVPRTEEAKQNMRKPKSPEGRANIAASNRRRALLKQGQVITLQ